MSPERDDWNKRIELETQGDVSYIPIKELTEKEYILQELEACQFTERAPAEALTTTLWKKFELGHEVVISHVHNEFSQWYELIPDLKKISEYIYEKELENPGFLDSLIKKWRPYEKRYVSSCNSVDSLNLKSLDDDELASEFNKWYSTYLDAWSLPLLSESWSLYGDNLIRNRVEEYLERTGKQNELNRVLQIMTAPVEKSFSMEEKEDLLRIARKAKSASVESVKDDLVEHAEKYHWLQNTYLNANALTVDFFSNRVKKLIKSGVEEEQEKIENKLSSVKEKKKSLKKEFDFPKEIEVLFSLTEKFAEWMDLRKKYNLMGQHHMFLFLDELGRRKGLTKDEIHGLIPSEYSDALKGKLDMDEIKERTRQSLVVHTPGEVRIYTGKKAQRINDSLTEDFSSKEELEGNPASPGKEKGKVKIIKDTSDVSKMEKGDVLVSSMTRPELFHAMELASAIVTDEGGITSHAAIVSRELGKPCVIGTKFATKMLKDGDLVEVDADEGIVRRLE